MIAVFATVTNFCFAQENKTVQGKNMTVKPSSRIGSTVGFQNLWVCGCWSCPEINDATGVSIFYHQTISANTFLSFEVGYHKHLSERLEYSTTYHFRQNRWWAETVYYWKDEYKFTFIPVTVGINCFLTKEGIRPYIGLEIGFLNTIEKYKTENYWIAAGATFSETYKYTDFLFVPTLGFSAPITKNICINANIKLQFDMAGHSIFFNTGMNVGVAFQIP